MNLISSRKPGTEIFNQKNDASGLEVSDSVSVTRPIDVCSGDIRELMLLLDVLHELAVNRVWCDDNLKS
jgi:hypothetical protein